MRAEVVLLIIIHFFFIASAYGQNFFFKLYFEDAIGNKDTIELGLDSRATMGIDDLFGEIDIIEEPYQNGLDVRITDQWTQFVEGDSTSYHSKKQVVPMHFDILNIIINTDYFPVTASWDSQVFLPVGSVSGSIITSINPGGWFDTGSPSDMKTVFLRSRDSITFTSNLENQGFNDNYGYILRDTMPTYWFTFAPSDFDIINNTNNISSKGQFSLFPNPTKDVVFVKNESTKKIKDLALYNLAGQLVKSSYGDEIDLSEQNDGIYFLHIVTDEGESFIEKVMKQ